MECVCGHRDERRNFLHIAGWVSDREKLKKSVTEIQKASRTLITVIEVVDDPYVDGFG